MTTLLTIMHEPDGKLDWSIFIAASLIFSKVYIVTTDKTNNTVIDGVAQRAKVKIKPLNGLGQARRDVLKFALEDEDDGPFFYCDIDRFVHWVKTDYAWEIETVLNHFADNDYLVVGRTGPAFYSHPYLQRETEHMMNFLASSYEHPSPSGYDYLSGARMFNKQAAQWIAEQSKAKTAATDIEWPDIVKDNGGKIDFITVDGLSYEGNNRTYEEETQNRLDNLWAVIHYLEDKRCKQS